ncbi:hypothetical protein V8C86DRAFT_2491703 [Haematococcus lacustris]
MIQYCDETQRTVCELNCRLVHVDAASAADSPGLSYPLIRVSPASEDGEDTGVDVAEIPVYSPGQETPQEALKTAAAALSTRCWASLPPAMRSALRQLQSVWWAATLPWHCTRRWFMGHPPDILLQALLQTLPPSFPPSSSSSPPRTNGWHAPPTASTNHSWPGALDPPQAGSQGQLPPPLDWHPHRPLLAVADGEGAVQVFDLAPVEQASSPHGHGSAPGNGRRPPSMLTTPSMRLAHRLQPCTMSLAWRPMSGRMLAVGTQGGVLAWTLGGSSRPPLGGLRGLGGPQGGPWVTWLPGPSKSAAYTALAWSPDGRLLAAAGPLTPGITLWSVASGERSQVGVGLAAFTQLRWSPCGAYLFAAGVGSQFYLLETGSWTSASWSTPPGCGPVTGAAWAPGPRTSPLASSAPLPPSAAHSLAGRGPAMGAPTGLAQPSQRLLLLSFAGGTAGGNLVALHLVEEPPSLVAQLLPVLLQDVQPRDDGHRSADSQLPAPSEAKPSLLQAALGYKLNGRKAVAGTMADWCWDASGERLAVLLQYPHPAAGQVALFAMSIEPVVTARLLGFARPPPAVDNEAAAAHSTSQVGGRVACHQCFTRGALFTIRAARPRGNSDRHTSGDVLYNLPCLW